MNRDDITAIIERIASKQHTEEDIKLLQQLLTDNRQIASQLGKYNINIAEGKEIHIGDRFQGLSIEDFKNLLQLLQPSTLSNAQLSTLETSSKGEQLERLALKIDLIEAVNLKLAAFNEINRSLELPDQQKKKFTTLASKIRDLKNLNQELETINNFAETLLKDAINILLSKLEELNIFQDENLTKAQSQYCIEEQLKLLIEFKSKLDQAKSVAEWLDSKKENLARNIGKYAISYYPESNDNFLTGEIEDFYLSVKQFIERLSHCLKWGRYNVLDMPSTPIVIDDKFYEKAFEYLKTIIPAHLPTNGIQQLKDYIDYLLTNLPSYQYESNKALESVKDQN